MPRKSYPSSKAISGMYFPSSASSGNCIPFQASILGRTFPLDPQPETTSHFGRKFRDAISRWRAFGKACPTSNAQSGTHFPQSTSTGNRVPFQRQIPGRIFRKPAHPESPPHFGRIRARNHRPIRPPINKEASSRTAGHEVHREFRTQRRPLNVAFVLRRTVEQGTSCPDAREDVTFRKMDRPPSAMGATPPARPSWRRRTCPRGLLWWGDPLRQPSCRAAS